jgi:hypothetical protein
MNHIYFYIDPEIYGAIPHPQPASSVAPSWMKEMPSVNEDIRKHFWRGSNTMKVCSGILDSTQLGYVIFAPWDFDIVTSDGQYKVETNWVDKFVDIFVPELSADYPFPEGHKQIFFKVTLPYRIKTSKGTSTLITSLKWRPEINHKVVEGSVDTDDFYSDLHFVFSMEENSRLSIRKGDPLLQIIPYRRESWTQHIEAKSPEIKVNIQCQYHRLRSHKLFGYFKEFWKKKEFK